MGRLRYGVYSTWSILHGARLRAIEVRGQGGIFDVFVCDVVGRFGTENGPGKAREVFKKLPGGGTVHSDRI